MLPILMNHDHRDQVGKIELDGGRLCVHFSDGNEQSLESMLGIFGDAGMLVTEMVERGGVRLIRKAQIIEFSIQAAQARPQKP